MPDYKVTAVDKDIRKWNGPNGVVYYLTVGLEDSEGKPIAKPVSIGKKSPDALKIGDTVYGTIIDNGDFPTDKWKAEPNPEYAGKYNGPRKSGFSPEERAKSADGQRQGMAIKAAIDMYIAGKIEKADIKKTAHWIYNLDVTQEDGGQTALEGLVNGG